MTNEQVIEQIVSHIVSDIQDEVEKAVALHDYVKEKIKFGFSKYFDAPTDEYTLSYGFGQCTPKSHLLVSLFRAAGFESYQHLVTLSKQIMFGIIPANRYWMISEEVSHSFVDVKVAGNWCSFDSHVIDTPLYTGAMTRLANEGRKIGYGIHSDSVNSWNGQGNAFGQYKAEYSSEDHGRILDLPSYFKSEQYQNKFLGVTFNALFKILGEFNATDINNNIDKLRKA